jgi:uncharacterized protein DUF6176
MKVELSRFRVKAGKSARADEWLKLLNDRVDECVQTLEREEMKLEIIFREMIEGSDYLYWVSIQGEGGQPVETSPFEIDQKYRAFFEECIDHDYGRRDGQPQVVMVPSAVARAMNWLNPGASAVAFQRREIIVKRPWSSPAFRRAESDL